MPTNTYVALQTQTLATSSASVTFSSIPSTYTDLYIVIQAKNLTGNSDVLMRFNSDSGTNYSATILGGDGSAYSARRTNSSSVILNYFDFLNSSTATQFNINIQNYSNATTYKTAILRANRADQATEAVVGLWRNTAAITQIDLTPSSSSFAAGSTFSLYGIKAQAVATTAKATGGTITYDAYGNVIHTFTSSGTFTPSVALTNVDYLVVAGGGGGGFGRDFSPAGSYGAGGGGAGGLRSTVSATGGGGALESQLSLTASAYTVTIGAGGAGATGDSVSGATGSNSLISGSGITTVTSAGGGGAGTVNNDGASIKNGLSGGSGGGGADSGGTDGTGGAGTSGQGFAGANSQSTNENGGGGGGAGSAGTSGTGSSGGEGGTAVLVPISGSSTYYAGGGGGGAQTGRGGYGGGTATTANKGGATDGIVASNLMNAAAATANTGGGGGGGYAAYNGGNGGSGIVIIRYSGL